MRLLLSPLWLVVAATNAKQRISMQSIKHLRIILGWTQKDLAESVGISRSHLSEIESGKKTPSLEVLSKIAASFDLGHAWRLLYIEANTHNTFDVAICYEKMVKDFYGNNNAQT
jgi:transcriptional regulator with XRE-family HTH domain